MHPITAVTSLLLSLAAAPPAAETPPAAIPPAAFDEFLASLGATRALDSMDVDVADGHLEINDELREVGPVSVAVYTEDEGSGRGLVTVGDAIVADVGFVDGAVA
ncbi:hypothetical protein [Nannocystis pusilla]|uniref:hypothetical protein n=1 Tax=Nannocystis pusilla TaxID=889268 RepID=UPI003DA4F8F1